MNRSNKHTNSKRKISINMKEISLLYYIQKDLAAAIEKDEFLLYYQPIIDTITKRITGVEALIRWKHPIVGIISPLKFIPFAEETRLIIPIGYWVIRTACSQLREWNKLGFTNISLSVNVSIIQLQHPGFAEAVSRILSKTKIHPEYLELEITESILLESLDVIKNLNNLKKLGVKITIDDFGTGYNSFKCIQELNVNNIKIDKAFIYNINDEVNKAIIDAIIKLGHDINIEVTAEGVETEEQYDYLKKKRCDKIQGYYFSKPLLPEEATMFFKCALKNEIGRAHV